ncbi:MAG: tRNA epoxyqueuosine(34) reductase QueG [Magnetococcales bacterium]|nr:tRNA epoxyqueuosine(34) reductase QueG [Magnetococcales bacterium]
MQPTEGNLSWHTLKESLRQQALVEGFSLAGFAAAAPPPHADYFEQWLQQNAHGNMHWLARQPERRQDPRHLLETLGSILVLGVNYAPGDDPLAPGRNPGQGWISLYARHRDYHDILKKRLQRLALWLEHRLQRPIQGRLLVDTAPLLEKPLACAAGLGWQGKNSLLVSRQFGCWLFLAEFLLPLPLPPDPPMADHCGDCRRCLSACPTDALAQPYRLHARHCLAYLTIEEAGPIPDRYRAAMGNRIYGCDDCLAVCPWNRFAPATQEVAFIPRPALQAPPLLELATLEEGSFRTLMQHSPIKRIGVVRFLRNVAVALGNWGAPEALPALAHLLQHGAPLVRGHAAWGIGRLACQPAGTLLGTAPERLLQEQQRLEGEPWVREEIQKARQSLPGLFTPS